MGQAPIRNNVKCAAPSRTAGRAEPRADSLPPACRSGWAAGTFLGVVGLGTAADLLSKHYAFAALGSSSRRSVEVMGDFLRFTLSANKGIVFGIDVPAWLVLAATLGAIVVVLLLFATSSSRSRGLHVALGMVLAGSLGNAYDRLFGQVRLPGEAAVRTGQVRDFIDVNLYFMRWPVFNVADVLLVVGVFLIVLHLLRESRRGGD